MLVVLAIISILILLFVPNLMKEKGTVQKTGQTAVVKVVESQAQMYELDHTSTATLNELMANNMITQKQAENYDEYYKQNKQENRTVPD